MTVRKLPSWFPAGAVTLCGTVWQKHAGDPGWNYQLEHEKIHAGQQTRDGCARFLARWIFSRSWRCIYEAEAYRASIAAGLALETCVRFMTGPVTWWACSSREQAIGLLVSPTP